jgi:threonine dehydrogenase-like Zn-dependent dehydrogenase
VSEEDLPPLAPDLVRVQGTLSAVSAGTELLVYRGQFPTNLSMDENIPALEGRFSYPLKYGYAMVGRVLESGSQVDPSWDGQLVFSFHPHETVFDASPGELMRVPPGLPAESAVFLPNMETAVNFLMDGAPLLGERVAVFGQGVVGLLTTSLLARFPLETLVTFDRYALRRQAALDSGADHSLDPLALGTGRPLTELLPDGADLTYELSGSPEALDQAISATGFAGRVVVGSWYGQKRASLDLGGYFHRSRIRLISSQVSSLAPNLSGRWNKERRFSVAWKLLRIVQPARYITHRFHITQAPQAYRLLDEQPEETLQVVFGYA